MDEPDSRARLIVERCPAPGGEAELSRAEAAHARARRLARGQEVTVIDGTGVEARATLLHLSRAAGRVRVEETLRRERPPPPIALFVAGLRQERLAWIAEKATELRAAALTILSTERTQRFRASADSVERLTRVAREAAKQCGGVRWPVISGPRPLAEVFEEERAGTKLILDPQAPPFPSSLEPPLAILIGPEGGWTRSERDAGARRGWTAAALPAGLLRAETAAIAALVLARAALERAAGARRKA
jgi:16S rRNA (uracil1498-N3)-methyltransferase